MATYELILSYTPPTGQQNVELTGIPQGYDDIILRLSVRSTLSAWDDNFESRLNNNTGTYTSTYGGTNNNGTAMNVFSAKESMNTYYTGMPANSSTANTFSNHELYIPSYTGNARKIIGMIVVNEANAAYRGYIRFRSVYSSYTGAVSSINLLSNNSWAAVSRIAVYGIKRS